MQLRNLKGKNMVNIVVLLVLGVGLLLFSQIGFNNEDRDAPIPTIIREPAYNFRDLEERLSSVFSRIEGAGEVSVLLNFTYSSAVLARDINRSETQLTENAENQVRNQHITNESANYVLSAGNPLVLREAERLVSGIVIIAEGGGNIHVVEALTNAARALLGIEPHRISVLTMGTS